MQQDPSSWNKPLYRTKSAATTSTSTSTATAAAVPSVVVTATVVAVASSSSANSSGTATGSSALPPPTIRSRSSASTPCLTSSHARRPNTNHNSDVLAIHHSFDLSKPSPSTCSPPLSPLLSPSAVTAVAVAAATATHLDSIDTSIDDYKPEHESSLESTSSSSLLSPNVSLLTSQEKRRHGWSKYNSRPALSLRDLSKDRTHDKENNRLNVDSLGTTGRMRVSGEGVDSIVDIDIDIQQQQEKDDASTSIIKNNNNNRLSEQAKKTNGLSTRQRDLLAHVSNSGVSDANQRNVETSEWQSKSNNLIHIQVRSGDK
ncbi:hypothetical protein BGZ49_005157, partial [Haplosporangium sp. Z 27]